MTEIPHIGWGSCSSARFGQPQARLLIKRFLADPDPAIHFAAIQWVGEQRLAEYRRSSWRVSDPPGSRQVFEGTLAALEMLHGKRRGRARKWPAKTSSPRCWQMPRRQPSCFAAACGCSGPITRR